MPFFYVFERAIFPLISDAAKPLSGCESGWHNFIHTHSFGKLTLSPFFFPFFLNDNRRHGDDRKVSILASDVN